jgi:hypothetical protein
MRARNVGLVVVALGAAIATTLALAVTSGAGPGSRPGAKALKAQLNGASEEPGPGDPDGRGRARIKLLRQFNAVCFRLRWRKIVAPTRAHVHRGAEGVAGPIVVTLFDADSVRRRGCVDGVDRALLREIRRNPGGFYVNVHNEDFPAGAIRGQLDRRGHRGQQRGRRAAGRLR